MTNFENTAPKEHTSSAYSLEENRLRGLLSSLKTIVPFFSPPVSIEEGILMPLQAAHDYDLWSVRFLREIFEYVLEHIINIYLEALAMFFEHSDQREVLCFFEESFTTLFTNLHDSFSQCPFEGFLLSCRENEDRGWIA